MGLLKRKSVNIFHIVWSIKEPRESLGLRRLFIEGGPDYFVHSGAGLIVSRMILKLGAITVPLQVLMKNITKFVFVELRICVKD